MKMKTIIDISWPISSVMTSYKNKSVLEIQELKNFNRDGVRETTFHMGSHSGTHVDAPSHFLKEGKTIDEIHVNRLIGSCVVLDMTDCAERITHDCLMKYDHMIEPGSIVLLKTTNSDLSPIDTFNVHFVYLEASGALYLAEKKIKAVAVDYLGIEHSQPGHPTHEALLNADVAIVEGIRLGHVAAGNYFFVCLPLYMIGTEAAPARAVLFSE